MEEYSVQLYKDGVAHGYPTISAKGTGATGVSFFTEMTSAAGAAGAYKVSVTAIGEATHNSSPKSDYSSPEINVYSVALTITGIDQSDSVTFGDSARTTNSTFTVFAIEGTNVTFSATAGSEREVTISGSVSASGNIVNIRENKTITAAFSALPPPAHIPVTNITGVPTQAVVGTPLPLTGTVDPTNATNRTIVWTVNNPGSTGAEINSGILTTTAAGTVVVRATITNGAGESTDYTQDFSITVNAGSTPPPTDPPNGGNGNGGNDVSPPTPPAPPADEGRYGSGEAAQKRWEELSNDLTKMADANTEAFNHVIRTGRNTVVPSSTIESLKWTNATLMMNTGAGVTYSISGQNIPADFDASRVNLSLRTGSVNAPQVVLAAILADASRSIQIPMVSKEDFGFTVNMHFNVGPANSGKSANLYRFNESTGAFEFLGSYPINEKGQAMFGISGGADYVVTVTEEPPNLPIVAGSIATGGSFHTVRPGDTMGRIANLYNTTLANLRALNPDIRNINLVRIGQQIRVR